PVAALLRGDVELALVSSPVRDRELEIEPLFDDEWAVLLAPTHPLAARPYVGAAELERERLLVHDSPRSDVDRLRELVASEGAAMPRATTVPLTDAIVDLVRAGLGVGLVSSWAVAPRVARGEVVARRFSRAGLPVRWSAVYRRDAAARFPLARFVELLREQAPPTVALRPRARREGAAPPATETPRPGARREAATQPSTEAPRPRARRETAPGSAVALAKR
ncbi:MAG TPA: substrate-binding domain-containing protein, partial [Polyangiaceae bacterium]|nr:substrate-binding domain-containing protein [Polyangiaceae bacterium]